MPETTQASGFLPWTAVKNPNLAFALVASGAIGYDPEREIGVYFHEKMTGHEKRLRFVVCPLDGEPLFWFFGTEQSAVELANKKYMAWQKKQAKVQH